MSFALRARYVYPVDRPAIEHALVTVDRKGWIREVGTRTDAKSTIDLGDAALLPGLVNCHTHLEFSDLKNPLGKPGMPFVEWIRLVITERSKTSGSSRSRLELGLEEGVRNGSTLFGEIATAEPVEYSRVQLLAVLFTEVIGFSRARADSVYEATRNRLNELQPHSEAEVGISPHAPYTVSAQLTSRLVELAKERVIPVAMHIAESREELQLLATGDGPFQELLDERSMWDSEAISRGSRPLDYLRILSNAPRSLVIHGNYLDEEELDFLAANAERMSLVYCPRTHTYFRHAPYPLEMALQKRVRVALGTDSRASNPDLSLLEEMRHVAREFSGINPNTVLRMGTLAGAEALGRDAEVGSITPGKLANLVAIPLKRRVSSAEDALDVALWGNAAPSKVWYRGIEWGG
jgi:cytosine/adenosine deaminase-related metal-dependent hydrolase